MNSQSKEALYELEASMFEWEIAPGKNITAWGFNQQLPGPVIRARRGDTLVVRLKNSLREPTMIHWHGIKLPAAMDGTGSVQTPVAPGQVFEYRFALPDAGTFWYHSHFNETIQVERGMYGAIIIEDDVEPGLDGDKLFMIDDMKLTPELKFTRPSGALGRLVETHDGRQGGTLLVNGKANPLISIYAGQLERWRFVNASSARYFKLSLGGKTFRIIGTDGGLIEAPVPVTEALITPGERLDIIAGPFEEGETFLIDSLAYNRSTFLRARTQTFAIVQVSGRKTSIAHVPARLRAIEALAPQNAPVNRKVRFSVRPSFQNGLKFLVNKALHANDGPVRVGELQVWEINNVSLMDHPFHLHGFFFQVLEVNGKAPGYKAWKDTVNLPPRTKLKIAWMPDNRPGKWMYHCHILEHHAAGMMANFEVVNGSGQYASRSGGECQAH